VSSESDWRSLADGGLISVDPSLTSNPRVSRLSHFLFPITRTFYVVWTSGSGSSGLREDRLLPRLAAVPPRPRKVFHFAPSLSPSFQPQPRPSKNKHHIICIYNPKRDEADVCSPFSKGIVDDLDIPRGFALPLKSSISSLRKTNVIYILLEKC